MRSAPEKKRTRLKNHDYSASGRITLRYGAVLTKIFKIETLQKEPTIIKSIEN